MTRLYSYVLRYDDGAAPNPYGGKCSLTICKPAIRRTASVGDWVVGTGSKNGMRRDGSRHDFTGHLVYAMRLSQKMTLEEYDQYCQEHLPSKLPDMSGSEIRKLGDCIYDYSAGGPPVQRAGNHGPLSYDKDLRGENALLSDHYYYFGENPIVIPLHLTAIIKTNQGHRKIENAGLIAEFEQWISKYQRNHHYGEPQMVINWEKKDPCSICEKGRIEESLVEVEEVVG